jgi:hypothetical protein
MNKGFADLCLTTWLRRLKIRKFNESFDGCVERRVETYFSPQSRRSLKRSKLSEAGDGTRTRNINLGKVALYH